MKRVVLFATLVCLSCALAGCGALLGFLQPSRTTVRLVNNSDFDIVVKVFFDEDQNVVESVIDDVGSELEFSLIPGESTSFSRDCDDLQAVKVVDAELRVIGAIGPHAESDILRDGDNFDCGDTVTFTFDHTGILIDFDVSTTVTSG